MQFGDMIDVGVNAHSSCSSLSHPPPSSFPPFCPTGIPSPPVDPAQFNSTCTCANVTWGLPEFDGTADVLQFIIAFTLPNSTTLINSTPVTVVQTALGNETKIDICGLVPNVVYDTMIISSNAVGNSSAVSFMMLIEAIGE